MVIDRPYGSPLVASAGVDKQLARWLGVTLSVTTNDGHFADCPIAGSCEAQPLFGRSGS